jgi:hypothetical protein
MDWVEPQSHENLINYILVKRNSIQSGIQDKPGS